MHAATAYARRLKVPLLILKPLYSEGGDARAFWKRMGFVDYPGMKPLHVHRSHHNWTAIADAT